MNPGKKILVTGGAGFIGSHLVDRLVESGNDVTVLDNLSTGKRDNLPNACRLLVGDIRDREFVDHSIADFQVIFHLAAFTSVAGSIEDPDTCTEINVEGTSNLLKAAARAGVR